MTFRLTSRNVCIAFGSIFVLAGFLGSIPNPIVSLEGIFETNAMRNLVHLLTGLVLEGGKG